MQFTEIKIGSEKQHYMYIYTLVAVQVITMVLSIGTCAGCFEHLRPMFRHTIAFQA